MPLRVHIGLATGVAAGLLAAVTACGGTQPDPAGRASPSATTASYAQPPDACPAVPDDLARRLRMREPTRRTDSQFASDEAQPEDPVVQYDVVSCDWVVDNPARGANGRPNRMTVSVSYAVIDPTRPTAGDLARSVLARGRDRLRTTRHVKVVRETAAPVSGYDGYYAYATRESVTGVAGETRAAVLLRNAIVTVEFAGADLHHDPAMPPGFQLETSAVPESRLRPTVTRLLPQAIAYLTGGAPAGTR